jgi:hypothetical protein
MKHDRASGHLHISDAGALLVLLVRNHNTLLVHALVRLDAAFQSVLPNVREHILALLEVLANLSQVIERCVLHNFP